MDRELDERYARHLQLDQERSLDLVQDLPFAGPMPTTEHDMGALELARQRTLELEQGGAKIIGHRSGDQLRSLLAREREQYFLATGERPHGFELERMALKYGTGVADDGAVKLPDNQTFYREDSGTQVDNQDHETGRNYRGQQLRHKIALGFKMGGVRHRKEPGSQRSQGRIRLHDTRYRGRRALDDHAHNL